MKRIFLTFLVGLASSFPLYAQSPDSQPEDPSAFNQAKEVYRTKIIEFQNEYAETIVALPQKYRAKLIDLKNSYFDSGNLEAGSAVDKEMRRFSASKESVTEKDLVKEQTNIRIAQQWFIDAPITAETIMNQKIARLTKEYIEVLEKLKEKLTKGRQIDEAYKVRDEIEAVKKAVPMDLAEEPAITEPITPKPIYSSPREAKPKISAQGLVLYYSFDRNEGSKITDRSGKRNDGKVYGAKWISSGKNGGGYEFDGKDDYLDAGNDVSLAVKEITMSVWVYFKSDMKDDYRRRRIISKSDGDGYDYYFQITEPFQAEGGVVLSGKLRGVPILQNPVIVPIGKWTHLAVSYSDYIVRSYQNGIRLGEWEVIHRGVMSRTKRPVSIGRFGYKKKWHYGFNGILDEVMIYNRALSDEEVIELYRATGGS